MNYKQNRLLVFICFLVAIEGCTSSTFNTNKNLDYCIAKAVISVDHVASYDSMPKSIDSGKNNWKLVNFKDWCSGFYPGVLWYAYEYTGDTKWKIKADSFTRTLAPLPYEAIHDHDLGFQFYCSFGNGLRLTGDTGYKKILLTAADSLATLFNPTAGTLLSWPWAVKNYGGHNTIIDNMMNLELLFWAAKNGGGQNLYNIAVQHANTTMLNHFRPDFSSYHVVVYDTLTGKAIKKITSQGYADASMWARGQGWAIYGFTMCYRETKNKAYLEVAQKSADRFLEDLPEDDIPYWDFNAPGIPNAPKDASAAAITASALLELSTQVPDKKTSDNYRSKAEKMLTSLSTEKYQSRQVNDAFILHCTGHKPAGIEINASLIYGDYYYMEALLRLKKLQEGKSIFGKL